MIKRLTVQKLNGRSDFDLCFNEDMNVLTGKNGCGKTTLLKLAWYMVSGNLDRILAEINFESASIITDTFTLSVALNKSEQGMKRAEWKFGDSAGNVTQVPDFNIDRTSLIYLFHNSFLAKGGLSSTLSYPLADANPGVPESEALNRLEVVNLQAEALSKKLNETQTGSVFFPTFRRIEGGFSLSKPDGIPLTNLYTKSSGKVEDAMSELSQRLSMGQHRFVASISTNDIVDMITRRYAQVSARININHTVLSQQIIDRIGQHTPVDGMENDAAKYAYLASMVNEVQKLVTDNSNNQQRLLKPFDALSQLITQIFQHKGIKIAEALTLGEANDAIPSDVLSSGEKQMLSFVAYNAFTRDSVIFIDEPEISLHVDWQRTLFSILESQGTNNQFIVATHSPFIYSKYADKEIALNSDRGE